MDQGPEIRQKVTRFRNVIEQIPDYVITAGSCVHSELVGKPKFPFLGPVRTAFISKLNQCLNSSSLHIFRLCKKQPRRVEKVSNKKSGSSRNSFKKSCSC